tara:strand:+ start:5370 stop:6782 length:1413 start_codon:yes stop_codon:yes gene_type:complete
MMIPKILIQTFKTNNLSEPITTNIQRVLRQNPEFQHVLVTDLDGERLIKDHFSHRVYRAYKALNVGAAKGDFIRYVALYVHGGVYLDLDSSISTHIVSTFDLTQEYIIFIDGANLIQWILMFSPKHPLMKKVIDEMVIRIEKPELNIFLATGPTLFTDVVYEHLTSHRVYDTRTNVPVYKRRQLLQKRGILEEARFLKHIHDRIPNYTPDWLYQDAPKYVPTIGSATPHLYVPEHVQQTRIDVGHFFFLATPTAFVINMPQDVDRWQTMQRMVKDQMNFQMRTIRPKSTDDARVAACLAKAPKACGVSRSQPMCTNRKECSLTMAHLEALEAIEAMNTTQHQAVLEDDAVMVGSPAEWARELEKLNRGDYGDYALGGICYCNHQFNPRGQILTADGMCPAPGNNIICAHAYFVNSAGAARLMGKFKACYVADLALENTYIMGGHDFKQIYGHKGIGIIQQRDIEPSKVVN